jgi:hypothetical protein
MISGRGGQVSRGASPIILGVADWDYSGDTLEIIEAPVTFDATHIEKFESVYKGGEITVSGQAIIGDTGMLNIETAFNAKTHITDLRLQLKGTPGGQYLTPDDTTTPPSYILITQAPNAVKNDASGTVSFSFKGTVSGKMKRMAIA